MVIQRKTTNAKTRTKTGTKASSKASTNSVQNKDVQNKDVQNKDVQDKDVQDKVQDDAVQPKVKKIQVNFKADPAMFQKLKALADRDSRTLSSLLIKIIKDYLATH